MADDFGYECVGANGSTSYKTPHLDTLAQTGIRFENCHSTPLCTPSRVQIMTGRYNFRNYIRFGQMDLNETTFAHVLKKAGYATCIVGKWQLGGGVTGPNRAGFDEYCLWQISEVNKGSRYANPKIIQNGSLLTDVQDRYGPDVFCDYLLDFVKRNRAKPFFAYWPMALTHSPFELTPDSSKERRAKPVDYFPDMVVYLDKCVGRVAACLDELNLRDNTLILFTGDNGTAVSIRSEMGARIVKGGKSKTIDTGTHVPLIANWPGHITSGKVCSDLVDFTDFLPTIAEAANASLPANITIDGRSFLPQMLGRRGNPREWIFCHYDPRHATIKQFKRFVRTHRWKLYHDGRLYNLEQDIEETHPITPESDNDDTRSVRKRLQQVLDSMQQPNTNEESAK